MWSLDSRMVIRLLKNITFIRLLCAAFGFLGDFHNLFRICSLLLHKNPKRLNQIFLVICIAFQRFLLGIRYFLTLLNPLFPCVPALTVVKYGVKNAS